MRISSKERTFYMYLLWTVLSLLFVGFLYKLVFPHGFSLHRGMVKIFLYFPTEDLSSYKKEIRWVRFRNDPQDLAKLVLEELAKGPKNARLSPVLPVGTKINGVYIASDGTAYADFSEEFIKNHPGGSAAERITVEAVFIALKVNVPKVKRVKFLVNGKEIKELRGHLDMTLPFSFRLKSLLK